VFLGITGYAFYRVPKQPVQIQKGVMALFALLCLLIAGVLGGAAAALPADSGVRAGILGGFWFLAKVFVWVYSLMWFRFTFPRFRFDQLMRLGWHFMIPLSIVNVMAIGLALVLHRQWGWGLAPALVLATGITLLAAAWLARLGGAGEPAACSIR